MITLHWGSPLRLLNASWRYWLWGWLPPSLIVLSCESWVLVMVLTICLQLVPLLSIPVWAGPSSHRLDPLQLTCIILFLVQGYVMHTVLILWPRNHTEQLSPHHKPLFSPLNSNAASWNVIQYTEELIYLASYSETARILVCFPEPFGKAILCGRITPNEGVNCSSGLIWAATQTEFPVAVESFHDGSISFYPLCVHTSFHEGFFISNQLAFLQKFFRVCFTLCKLFHCPFSYLLLLALLALLIIVLGCP